MAEEWFTYSELAERLNISPEAVRQKAIRHRWPRRSANDGKTQVRVDLQDVVAAMPQRRAKEPSDARPTPDQPPVEPASDTRTIDALESHIATLKEMVAKAEALAGQYRERADGERQRADAERAKAEAERDRADGLANQIRELLAEKAVAADKGVELEQRIEELRAIVSRMVNRPPWWRRLVG
jgi:DNA primase